MLGGVVGHLDVVVFEHETRQLGAFALVGMGAVFAGVIRAPITSVLIIFEMTGGYGLVLPLMLANMTSYLIARRLRPTPIYEALLFQDGVVLPEAALPPHPIEQLRVEDAMVRDVVVVRMDQPITDVVAQIGAATFANVAVVDSAGSPLGLIAVANLRAARAGTDTASSLMQPAQMIPAKAPLLGAIIHMNHVGVRQLLIVDAETERQLVGILAVSDIVRALAVHAQQNNLIDGQSTLPA